jgi:hypothetical protein
MQSHTFIDLYELGEVKGITQRKDLPIISFNDSRILRGRNTKIVNLTLKS